jgi:hypothetical protein
VEKYGTDRRATDDNIIGRMRFECWISKATDTSQNMQYLLLSHFKNDYANAPQYYVYTYIAFLVYLAIYLQLINWLPVARTKQWRIFADD